MQSNVEANTPRSPVPRRKTPPRGGFSSGAVLPELTDREHEVLGAVIDSFVRSATPSGSRKLVREYEFGVSSATIRNAMADLERKGLLMHPHTSAGRLPTDLAYRYYVDHLMRRRPMDAERQRVRAELEDAYVGGVDDILAKAVRVLTLLTGELGLAVGPVLAGATLRRIELVRVSAEKVLIVLTLESGLVRTVYVDVESVLPRETLQALSSALSERLSGDTLREITRTLRQRLGDLHLDAPGAQEMINIFVQGGQEIFEWARTESDIHLGSPTVLAGQPEFTEGDRLRSLLKLTERRELLAEVLGDRKSKGAHVTIGQEHGQPELDSLTIVTANYEVGNLQGTVGVIGPTRMPYDKVVSLVDWTSEMLTRLTP